MNKVTTIGIDLAKNVFQVHGADDNGQVVFRKQLRRGQLLEFFANMNPVLIGMEACSSSHHWARELCAQGHHVKLMAPQFVKPYVKSNKNDVTDAQAICEAVTRPTMRFVPVKTIDQQSILALHNARQGLMKARLAQTNQLRSTLAEFGIFLAQGGHHLRKGWGHAIEQLQSVVPQFLIGVLSSLYEMVKHYDQLIDQVDDQIKQWAGQSPQAQALQTIPGVGVLGATALAASIGDVADFKNGRQLAAWLGLVPKQHSSGGKSRLLGISKRGDKYLRMLLIHGGRSLIATNSLRKQPLTWLSEKLQHKHHNILAVALAHRNVRIAWALLSKGQVYEAKPVQGGL